MIDNKTKRREIKKWGRDQKILCSETEIGPNLCSVCVTQQIFKFSFNSCGGLTPRALQKGTF